MIDAVSGTISVRLGTLARGDLGTSSGVELDAFITGRVSGRRGRV